ncbi:TetR family transcriptional regulator [Arthrobacter woluwensis]|uniref:DNA-binding transcriptional regulator, AcrR family n=1 Tax=Arthrobacter woluwensis TaxID=156980 RepID=A0A1H4W5A1_9MICC|nr:TetR family transcriptional regulator [Arthrobacter woluwensis]SEC87821.1 DNA-binding transcriptional regulator, AcrR family [Arthrobacter woluwensis]
MARQPLRPDELLTISEHCAEVFLSAGDATPTVATLAAAAGLSERTFYRYFPTKEDSLRPLFDRGDRIYASALAAQPDGVPLNSALESAFTDTLARTAGIVSTRLMQVVLASSALRRIWLEASYEAAELLRAPVARIIGAPEDSLETTVASGHAITFMIAGLGQINTTGQSPQEAARAVSTAMARLAHPVHPGAHQAFIEGKAHHESH